MDDIQTQGEAMELEPMDVSTADAADAADAAGQRELSLTTTDRFPALAAKEYREGHVDPTLWARASAQCGGDEALVIAAYLRARATALQLEKRDRRQAKRPRKADPTQDTKDRKVEAEPRAEGRSTVTVAAKPGGVHLKPKHAGAAAVLAVLVAVVWLIAHPQESESIAPPSVSAAVRASAAEMSAVASSTREPAPANRVEVAQPVVGTTSGGASEVDLVPPVKVTVQQLKEAGNWNVLVLYASKWTRDEPKNAAAWYDLSMGYAKLQQLNDALVAAKKAVELSPEDMLLWRNVGQLHLALEFLPEAASAFDRVLAASPDDPDALCGAAVVANKLGRTKDAGAIAMRLKSSGGSCPQLSEGESVAVSVSDVATKKRVSSARR